MRWTAVVVAVAMMLGGGCASLAFRNPFAAKRGPEPTVLPPQEWAALKRENAQRLAGEGIPPREGATAPPRPTGGEIQQGLEFFKFVFYKFPKQTLDFYMGRTPGRYARMMEDDKSPDLRRTGILKLVTDYEFARKDPYTKRYWQIAQGDPDYLVRVAAIRALDRARMPTVTPIAIRALDDPNPLLRLEAAKALANVPDEKSVPALIKHMDPIIEQRAEGGRLEQVQETRDVRVASADALRNFPTREVAKALVDVLRDKEFETSWQARKSLVLMTGHDYKYDQARWREYLASAGNPFGN
ncbi:MAG: putative lyase [Phycisphaerales bacterium]|nr:putative lyase [Phycisphaerales bacterium]